MLVILPDHNDYAIDPDLATPRERCEAVARSLRSEDERCRDIANYCPLPGVTSSHF
jgi:hypothetical protein